MMNSKMIAKCFVATIAILLSGFAFANEKNNQQKIGFEHVNAQMFLDIYNQHIKLDVSRNNKKMISLDDIRFNDTPALYWTLANQTENSI